MRDKKKKKKNPVRKALHFHSTHEDTESQTGSRLLKVPLCSQTGPLTQEEYLKCNFFSLVHSVLNSSSQAKMENSTYIAKYP